LKYFISTIKIKIH